MEKERNDSFSEETTVEERKKPGFRDDKQQAGWAKEKSPRPAVWAVLKNR